MNVNDRVAYLQPKCVIKVRKGLSMIWSILFVLFNDYVFRKAPFAFEFSILVKLPCC